MSLCSCPERTRCASDWCREAADWSVWQPTWPTKENRTGQPGSFKFMCDAHAKIYRDAMTKRIPGIDRPEGADDDWRGSILDCIRLAGIAMDFEQRSKQPTHQDTLSRHGDAARYTPAQLKQVYVLRKHLLEKDRAA